MIIKLKKLTGRKIIVYTVVLILLLWAGFISFDQISGWLKCRPVKTTIKVNKNVEPLPDTLPKAWRGIIPGRITIQEAENILKDVITERKNTAGKTILYLGKEKDGPYVPSVLIDRDGVVEKINITPQNYTKSHIVAEYGEPEGETRSRIIMYSPHSGVYIYASRGVLADFDPLSGTVYFLSYFKPMSMQKFRETLGKGYEQSVPGCIY